MGQKQQKEVQETIPDKGTVFCWNDNIALKLIV
jgi:hypothetical protein